jgi:hypothetical protein
MSYLKMRSLRNNMLYSNEVGATTVKKPSQPEKPVEKHVDLKIKPQYLLRHHHLESYSKILGLLQRFQLFQRANPESQHNPDF